MKRIFLIWNRGYKHICVLADDINEALGIATKLRHITHPTHFRKFEDRTDEELGPEADTNTASLQALLNGDQSGKVKVTDNIWHFD